MRCTCGYQRFAERVTTTTTTVERWQQVAASGGFGASPYGTSYGAGAVAQAWGRFELSHVYGTRSVFCESCKRVRREYPAGGMVVYGAAVSDRTVYFVLSDIEEPTTCVVARFEGQGESYDAPLTLSSIEIPILDGTPLETEDALPQGAMIADTVMVAIAPVVVSSGDYIVSIVDKCNDNVVRVATMYLEAPVQILKPKDADLGGAPAFWLNDTDATLSDTQQEQGVAIPVIPFDKCAAVLEYDSSLNTLPSAQGWTAVTDSSAWALTSTKVLYCNSGTGQDSYWAAELTLETAPEKVHAYARILAVEAGTEDAPGFTLLAVQADSGGPYNGGYAVLSDTQIDIADLSDETTEIVPIVGSGWRSIGFTAPVDADGVAYVDDVVIAKSFSATEAGTPADPVLNAQFGKLQDSVTLKAYVRHVVVSASGRFVRPSFLAFADVTSPIVRLYLSRPAISGSGNTARFVLRYTQSSDPYVRPEMSTALTVPVTVTNQLLELPISLPGLQANLPFRFTIERDWSHGTDTFEGTVYLHYATVRGV